MKAKVKATTTFLAFVLGAVVAFRSHRPRSPLSARRASVAKTAGDVDQPAVGTAGAVSAMQALPFGDIGLVQDARQIGTQSSIVVSKRSGPSETRPPSIISSPLPGILLADEAETIDGESSVVSALLDKLADVKERAEEKKLEEAEMKKKINAIKEKAWEEARQIEQQYQERTDAKKVDEAQMERVWDTTDKDAGAIEEERAKKEVERIQGHIGNEHAGAKDESAAKRKEEEENARVVTAIKKGGMCGGI